MYPKFLGRFRVHDSLGVQTHDILEQRLRESQYSQGNSHYVLSLPNGSEEGYEAEDSGELMRIYRAGVDSRELVCAVPSGKYRLETDEAGAHLYRIPEDQPERAPLSDQPTKVGDNMCAALARLNERNQAFYGSTGLVTGQSGRINATADNAPARLNALHRAHYGH